MIESGFESVLIGKNLAVVLGLEILTSSARIEIPFAVTLCPDVKKSNWLRSNFVKNVFGKSDF